VIVLLDLELEIAGLKLRNPIMQSAGILGLSGQSLRTIWEAGAGAVVTKSLGLRSRIGHPNPTIVNIGCGFINSIGLPNPGADEYGEDIRTAKSVDEIVIVASIYGAIPEELAKAAKLVEGAGADAVEINLSCPNVEGVGMEIGQKPRLVQEIIRAVKRAIKVPIFAKLTPNVSEIKVIARAAAAGGADGLVAINTIRAIAIDLETGRPILFNKIGGLSGPAIKPIALRCVYETSKEVKIPVIGCGGITRWEDAVEFFLAGASAVQIGTAIAYNGLGVFSDVKRGLEKYLKKKGYKGVGEIVGLSHGY
jgi:dihydroorotate dehydrogenase (NAD+) catalytic subunit